MLYSLIELVVIASESIKFTLIWTLFCIGYCLITWYGRWSVIKLAFCPAHSARHEHTSTSVLLAWRIQIQDGALAPVSLTTTWVFLSDRFTWKTSSTSQQLKRCEQQRIFIHFYAIEAMLSGCEKLVAIYNYSSTWFEGVHIGKAVTRIYWFLSRRSPP